MNRPRANSAHRVCMIAVAVACSTLAASCTADATSASTGTTTAPSSPPHRVGVIDRPDCIPTRAGFTNVPTGTQFATPVAVLGTGPRGVVLGAQSNGGVCQMSPVAEQLAQQGYHVAFFEWGPADNTKAMAAAVNTLVELGVDKVVVGGFSEGALIGLGGAPTFGPMVVGVMSISGGPSPDDGYPDVTSLSRFPGPILLVSAKDDSVFPPGTSAAIAAKHSGPETVLTLAGEDHALALFNGTHAAQVHNAVTTFLRAVLPAS